MASFKNIPKFFSSLQNTSFIVCGASTNPSKFGFKVLQWYLNRDLPVVPINPTTPEILGAKTFKSLKMYSETAPKNERFSISVITPPQVSLALVDEFVSFKDRINAIWFQPGSYDSNVIDKLVENGLENLIYQGNCILVQGDEALHEYYKPRL